MIEAGKLFDDTLVSSGLTAYRIGCKINCLRHSPEVRPQATFVVRKRNAAI